MHGKTRAGVVCFSLERKKDFASPWRLYVGEKKKLISKLILHDVNFSTFQKNVQLPPTSDTFVVDVRAFLNTI